MAVDDRGDDGRGHRRDDRRAVRTTPTSKAATSPVLAVSDEQSGTGLDPIPTRTRHLHAACQLLRRSRPFSVHRHRTRNLGSARGDASSITVVGRSQRRRTTRGAPSSPPAEDNSLAGTLHPGPTSKATRSGFALAANVRGHGMSHGSTRRRFTYTSRTADFNGYLIATVSLITRLRRRSTPGPQTWCSITIEPVNDAPVVDLPGCRRRRIFSHRSCG